MPATSGIEFRVEDGVLHMRVPLTGTAVSKTSGKNIVKASTGGFQPIAGSALKVNVTVIAPVA